MYLCYVDESGTPELSDPTQSFVYAGLAIPGETWLQKDREIETIKSKYELGGLEIHTAWMIRKYIEQDKIPNFQNLNYEDRRKLVKAERLKYLAIWAVTKDQKQLKAKKKEFSSTDPYIHLTHDERKLVVKELIDLIGGWTDCRIFCEAVKKKTFDVKKAPLGGIYEESFHQLVTRFDAFLANKGKDENKTLNGVLISDNNESVNHRLTGIMRKFHAEGTHWRDIQNIVETPLFVDSKLTSMIQMVDIVAYSIRRYLDNNEVDNFKPLLSRFDRVRGKLVGGRHFVPGEACRCLICTGHNRNYRSASTTSGSYQQQTAIKIAKKS